MKFSPNIQFCKKIIFYLSAIIQTIALSELSYAIEIITPSNDDRIYKYLVLDNKIKVLLVSDKDSVQSAAALSVEVGSLDNPDDILGLAHFNEHMLFLGTEKYPQPEEYFSFINSNNGSANAFTALDHSTYYFNIDNKSFFEALDRFSQFFISPKFDQIKVEDEINAVDSEYNLNLSNDNYKINEVFNKIVFKKTSAYSKFYIGNRKTLTNVLNLRERLIDFHNTKYSSDLMTLVIVSSETIEQLEDYAKKYFSPIKLNPRIKKKGSENFPIDKTKLPGKIAIRTVKNLKLLSLMFPLPKQADYYDQKPAGYLASLLGEESEGSLTAILKELNLASSLVAWSYDTNDFSMIGLDITLSDNGKTQQDTIIKLFFKYLEYIKKVEPQKWRFNEMNLIGKRNFEASPKEPPEHYVLVLSSLFRLYPVERMLIMPYTFNNYDANKILDVLSYITPENLLATYASDDVEGNFTEPYSITKYNYDKYSPKQLKSFTNFENPLLTKANFKLPQATPFLTPPKNDKILEPATKAPILLERSDKLDFWFFDEQKLDRQNANFKLSFNNNLPKKSSLTSILTEILAESWLETISEKLYPAIKAGIKINIGHSFKGLEIELFGIKESIYPLLDTILSSIKKLEITEGVFTRVTNNIAQRLGNYEKDQPVQKAWSTLSFVVNKPNLYYKDKIKLVKQVNLKMLNIYKEAFFSSGHVTMYLHGRFNRSRARDFSSLILEKTDFAGLAENKILDNKISDIKRGNNIIVLDSVSNDSSVASILQSSNRSMQEVAYMMILQNLISEPFFSQLRTTEQLGYIAEAGGFDKNQIVYLYFVVQSPKKSPGYIDDRISSFIEGFSSQLKATTDEQFNASRQAIIEELKEYPRTIDELSDEFWGDILKKNFDFKRKLNVLPYLQNATKDSVIDFWKRINNVENKKNLAIWIIGKDKTKDIPKEKTDLEFNLVSDVAKFKATLNGLDEFKIK